MTRAEQEWSLIEALEYCKKKRPSNKSCAGCPYAWLGCGIDAAIEKLKAQEPIKPQVTFNPAGQPMWACGNCGTTLFFKFPKQTDDEDQRSVYGFCNYCGRKVKWE